MKANLLTRIIMDTENNKVYLAVEGKIENASDEEKNDLRDTLVNAFSYVLGLPNTLDSKAEILDDFENFDSSKEEEVSSFLNNSCLDSTEVANEDKVNENGVENNNQTTEKVFSKNKEQITLNISNSEPAVGIGAYSKLTASQIIEKYGEEGVRHLELLLPVLQRNVKRFPKNTERINSILRAIENYKAGGMVS